MSNVCLEHTRPCTALLQAITPNEAMAFINLIKQQNQYHELNLKRYLKLVIRQVSQYQ